MLLGCNHNIARIELCYSDANTMSFDHNGISAVPLKALDIEKAAVRLPMLTAAKQKNKKV